MAKTTISQPNEYRYSYTARDGWVDSRDTYKSINWHVQNAKNYARQSTLYVEAPTFEQIMMAAHHQVTVTEMPWADETVVTITDTRSDYERHMDEQDPWQVEQRQRRMGVLK
jgi:hypothetical protein